MTSKTHAPWHIIPADHKWFMRALVSQIIVDEINSLSPKYPILDKEAKSHLEIARKQIEIELGLEQKS